jgi:phosphoserine phosphatase RsbU/P
VLLLFTDGVTERRNDGRLFGEERLTRLLAESPSARSADELATMILDGVIGFAPDPPQDDVAFVVVRCARPA